MDETTRKQFDRWVDEWRSGFTHVSDLTHFAETLIERSGSLEIFHASPDEIKDRILEHVAEYQRSGESSYIVSRTGDTMDRAPMIGFIAGLLNAAGLTK